MSVAVVVTTYFPPGEVGARRVQAAKFAVNSWLENLDGDDVHIEVVDDGSAYSHLMEWGRTMPVQIETQRLGCGGAFAAGVRTVVARGATAIFYAQDDWELMERLDLAPSLELLNQGVADIVRLGPTHPNLAGRVMRTFIPDAEWCLRYDWIFGGYVVGWRPALYHRSVFDRFPLDGLEGLSAIEGERVWLERMAADPNPPRVFHAPNCTLAGPFRHIDTVELGEDDPATLTARYA